MFSTKINVLDLHFVLDFSNYKDYIISVFMNIELFSFKSHTLKVQKSYLNNVIKLKYGLHANEIKIRF